MKKKDAKIVLGSFKNGTPKVTVEFDITAPGFWIIDRRTGKPLDCKKVAEKYKFDWCPYKETALEIINGIVMCENRVNEIKKNGTSKVTGGLGDFL